VTGSLHIISETSGTSLPTCITH